MSREIKFRAWVKPGELTNHVNGVIADAKPDFYESECLIERLDLTGKKNFREIFDFDRIELMQYTGLKDKNGVDIYEGDILYYTPFETHSNDRVVEYKLGFYHGKLIRNGYSQLLHECIEDVEVIGNIYSNPGLLEEEDE